MGIDPMNNISIIIRILFAVTIFQQAQGMPTFANGLVGEVLNESPHFQGYNQCGISRHTNNGEMKY
jgi:hypothetical protein